jgi:hypothetical protein
MALLRSSGVAFLCSVCLLREREDRGVSAYTQRREEEQLVLVAKLQDGTDGTLKRGSEKTPDFDVSANKDRPSALSDVLQGSAGRGSSVGNLQFNCADALKIARRVA